MDNVQQIYYFRNRGGWSNKSIVYLEKIKKILQTLEEYWPLTLRQIYYQLVSALIIENNQKGSESLVGKK